VLYLAAAVAGKSTATVAAMDLEQESLLSKKMKHGDEAAVVVGTAKKCEKGAFFLFLVISTLLAILE
jgi:hypothetical protein